MDPLQVIAAFDQTGKTCKAIGTIKVAIARFGVDNVFQTQFAEGQYTITLSHGGILQFSQGDYNYISGKAGFILNDDKAIYDYALLCFVVYVRNYMNIHHVGQIMAAWHVHRGDGIGGDYAYQYLGFTASDVRQLTDYKGTTDPAVFTAQPLYLLCNNVHVVLGAKDVYDNYGTPAPTTAFVTDHSDGTGLMWGYIFT